MDNNFYTQTFKDFAGAVGPMDLALYAGAGLVLWVLFKEQLSPLQKVVGQLFGGLKSLVPSSSSKTKPVSGGDVFFDLVASWKQTRDLAVKSGCSEAVKVADQMFPYLSPTVCGEKNAESK